MISMLNHYKNTLGYVGLPEALLGWGSDAVTRIGGKCVKLELERIENKQLSLIKFGAMDRRKVTCPLTYLAKGAKSP